MFEWKNRFLMDEAGAVDAAGGGGAAEAAAVDTSSKGSGATGSNHPDYGELKKSLEASTRGYQEVNQKIGKIDQRMVLLDKLEGLFRPEEPKTRKLDANSVNYDNLTDAAKELIKSGEMTEGKLTEIQEQLQELRSYKEVNEFKETFGEFTGFWTENVFGNEKSFTDALDKIGELKPDIAKEYDSFVSQGKLPTKAFINKINGALKDYVLANMLNPESKVAKSIYTRINQKDQLARNSTFDGDNLRGGQSRDNDIFSVEQVLYHNQ